MLARVETPLKRILESEGRSQSWLARTLGVSRNSVQTWVHGIYLPQEATRDEICRILGRTAEELGWTDDPERQAAA